MKITGIAVDGYGIWSGLKLDDLDEGLNVFYGPNEAGKTTLLQFVRSAFYGFSPGRRGYLPPAHGGRAGGSVQIEATGGRYLVGRYDDPKSKGTGPGQLVLETPDGTRGDERLLGSLLAGVDEAIFNNVFAIGLRELQELAVLGATEAAALLYNLSAGLDRVSLVDVMRELGTSRKRILATDGQSGQAAELVAQRDRLRAEIEELGHMTRHYGRLSTDRGQLEREAARLEEQQKQTQYDLRVVEIALAVRERWRERAALEEKIAALGPAGLMPEAGLERLEGIRARIGRHTHRAAQLRQGRKELADEAKQLKVNERLWRQGARIEALCEQQEWIGKLEEQILQLELEIGELEPKLTVQQQRVGIEDLGRRGPLPTLSAGALSSLRKPAQAMRRASARVEEARQEASKAEDKALMLGEELERALKARGLEDLAGAMDTAGDRMAQLRRRVQVDERLEQMSRYRSELEEQSHTLVGRQILPMWVVVGLGGVFVLGVLLLMAAWFMPASVIGSYGMPLSLLGLAGIATAVTTKVLLDRSNSRQLEECQKQIGLLNLQIKQAKEERESLDKQLPRGGGPMLARLQTAERELAELEELTPLDSRRQAALEEAEAAAARVGQAEQEVRAARARWRDALAARGLPGSLGPKQVRKLMEGSDRINEIIGSLDRRREELQQRRRELDAICTRVGQVAEAAGLDLERLPVGEQLKRLGEAVRQQEECFERREALRTQARKLRRKQSRHEAAAGQWRRRLKELLREAGVETEEEFQHRAAQYVEARSLVERRAGLAREIEAAIGGHCEEEAIAEQLSAAPGEQLVTRRLELARRLEQTQADLQNRYERSGQIKEQLKTLSDDKRLPAKQLELATVDKQLEDAICRWQVLAVTSRMLDGIRTSYERDRQPETLREASGYLERFTEGRYRRVWTPLDEDLLWVDDAEGKSVGVERLSQGTREQLFLCLRLALCATYGRRGVRLPLVLDDVLVNFDAQRAKAAATMLNDFAKAGHQLLVFTCHEHIMKLFKSMRVPVTVLPEHGECEAAVVVEAPRGRRRRAEVAAEAEPVFEPEVEEEIETAESRVTVVPSRVPPVEEEEFEEEEPEDFEEEYEEEHEEVEEWPEEEEADEEIVFEEEPEEDEEEYDEDDEDDEEYGDEEEEDEDEEEEDEGEDEDEEEEDEADFQWEAADEEEDDEDDDFDDDHNGAEAA